MSETLSEHVKVAESFVDAGWDRGIAVAVLRDGECVLDAVTGADLDGTPLSTDTRFLQAYSGIAFWDTDYSHTQWSRAFGIGTPSIIAERNDVTHYTTAFEGGDAYDVVWAKSAQYDGNTAQNGSDGYGIWNSLMTLAAGLERSPVNFTPASFADGLDQASTSPYRCIEERFWGTDHPQMFRVAWYKDNPSGSEGYTTLYWVNKQSSFGTPGYYESYDGYYTYFGLNDLPSTPSDDTANQPVPPVKQIPRIGVDPFKSCPSIGLQGGLYEH